MGSKTKLSILKALCLQLFLFDQEEGVHGNDQQRLKPRCLLEIGLRPYQGDQRPNNIEDSPLTEKSLTEPLMAKQPIVRHAIRLRTKKINAG